MSKEIEKFVESMKQKGVTLTTDGKFVKASPPDKMSVGDMLTMQKLNKKGELYHYLLRF